jgi:hypothetical protein
MFGPHILCQPHSKPHWLQVGVVQGLLLGSSIGAFHCALYAAQGTALIYGMWGITTGRYRGGEVVNVLIATLIGAAAAGKVRAA